MRTRPLIASLAAGIALFVACGVDPSRIATHDLYAKDGQAHDPADSLSFAVVGSTRSLLPAKGEAEPSDDVVKDIQAQAPLRDLQFVVLTGDYVRRSATSEWSAFDQRWKEVLKGSTLADNQHRRTVLPLPGNQEMLGDKRLKGYGAAFPGVGAPIGYNRVGSWYSFDQKVGKDVWRFVFLDTHKAALGSRWQEEEFWLPKVVSGDDFDHLLVFMPQPLVTMASGTTMDPDDGPSELLSIIDDNSGIMKLMGVFAGGASTNEVYLPSGSYGEAHVVAGNGGVPAADLARWGAADAAGLKDVHLEAMYDLALMNEFDAWSGPKAFSEQVIDHAKARGSFESYTGVYDGKAFPVQGWWVVDVSGKTMKMTFRMRRYDGTFHDVYAMRYTKSDGWIGEALKD